MQRSGGRKDDCGEDGDGPLPSRRRCREQDGEQLNEALGKTVFQACPHLETRPPLVAATAQQDFILGQVLCRLLSADDVCWYSRLGGRN